MENSPKKKSKISTIFLLFLLIVAILGTSLWIALKRGITLERLSIASIEGEQLTIRLDDRFSISIDQLNILDRQPSGTASRPGILITRFNAWAHLFKEIRISRIFYRDNVYTLLFKDNKFTVAGDDFHLNSTLSYEEGEVRMEISDLDIKPHQLKLAGKTSFQTETKRFEFIGLFTAAGINGEINLSYHRDRVIAEIQTESFTDLRPLLTQLSVDPEAVSWVAENIIARDLVINKLQLDFPIVDGKADIQPYSISGSGIATDATIKFDPSLPPVRCKHIQVSFVNDQLFFGLDDAWYKEKSLAGSNVKITNLLGDDSRLIINILTQTQLDDEIHELLAAYDISIPFTQHSGTTTADLFLDFDLPDFTLQTQGKFTTGEGKWTSGEITFVTVGTDVQLKDDVVFIDKSKILYQDTLQTKITGFINTTKQKAELIADINQFDFRDGEHELVKIRDLTTPIDIRYNKDDMSINLLQLKTEIALSPSGRTITLSDLKNVKPYIPYLEKFPLDGGKIHINFTNPDKYDFNGSINTTAIPLSSDNEPITHFTFHGTKVSNELNATVNEEKVSLALSNKMIIHLHDYQLIVDLDEIAEIEDPGTPLPVFISGPSILFKSVRFSVPTKNFLAELTGEAGEAIKFTADFDQGRVLFESDGKEMSLTASEINAMIAQDFFPFTDLEGGRFNLSLTGKNYKNFVGVVEFSNVLIKKGVILNNVLSFINAVPALATLSSPGFDANGYQVNEGIAYFANNNDILTIHHLHADGQTINCEAEGWVNLENKTLELNLEMISLKDYSKIISTIPWVGYVILGENGSISTSLDIKGTLEQPEITTNLTKEIVMTPINMIERTIKWPFRLFDKMKEFKSQQGEQEEGDYIYQEATQ